MTLFYFDTEIGKFDNDIYAMDTSKYKTVKISSADYIVLTSLQHYTFRKKKLSISKKSILGWVLRKAYDDIAKFEEKQNS